MPETYYVRRATPTFLPEEVNEEALEMELLMLGVGLLLLSSEAEGKGVEKGRFKATKCS